MEARDTEEVIERDGQGRGRKEGIGGLRKEGWAVMTGIPDWSMGQAIERAERIGHRETERWALQWRWVRCTPQQLRYGEERGNGEPVEDRWIKMKVWKYYERRLKVEERTIRWEGARDDEVIRCIPYAMTKDIRVRRRTRTYTQQREERKKENERRRARGKTQIEIIIDKEMMRSPEEWRRYKQQPRLMIEELYYGARRYERQEFTRTEWKVIEWKVKNEGKKYKIKKRWREGEENYKEKDTLKVR